MDWSRLSRETIATVALTIPDDTPFKDRKRIIFDAYPFGRREYWPYKAWCKAQREYLAKHDPKTPPPPPLFAGWERDPISGRPIIPAPQKEPSALAEEVKP